MITNLERESGSTAHSAQIRAVSDDRAGNARQASALAAALGGPAAVVPLSPRAPWRWLAPRQVPGSGAAFGPAFAALLRQPPALAIGCGRQAALATRLLRRAGAKTVQILDPRIDPAHWDLVVAPEHDGLAGDNVLTLLGSLHPVDDAWLSQARASFAGFADLPSPRTALLLGGPTRHAGFDAGDIEALADLLADACRREGGSLIATTSRRTPQAFVEPLRRRVADVPGRVWRGPEDGPNPYAGLLAWADRIICSPDSVNMVSEACATRAPVHVFDPTRVDGRPRRFLDALLARGRIRALDDALASFEVTPLRETARIAGEVRVRLGLPAG